MDLDLTYSLTSVVQKISCTLNTGSTLSAFTTPHCSIGSNHIKLNEILKYHISKHTYIATHIYYQKLLISFHVQRAGGHINYLLQSQNIL